MTLGAAIKERDPCWLLKEAAILRIDLPGWLEVQGGSPAFGEPPVLQNDSRSLELTSYI
jgi:hypothetical protein